MINKYFICDIDDVLLNSKPIEKYLPKNNTREEWDEFAKHYSECKINENIAEIVKALYVSEVKPIFITAREDYGTARRDTIVSLILALGFNITKESPLFMREYCNYEPSDIVKKQIYIDNIKDKYNILFAIDDDVKNSNMWKELGIESFVRLKQEV